MRTKAWKALLSEAVVTRDTVPGRYRLISCLEDSTSLHIRATSISVKVLPSRQLFCIDIPRTSSPVTTASLSTALQADRQLVNLSTNCFCFCYSFLTQDSTVPLKSDILSFCEKGAERASKRRRTPVYSPRESSAGHRRRPRQILRDSRAVFEQNPQQIDTMRVTRKEKEKQHIFHGSTTRKTCCF